MTEFKIKLNADLPEGEIKSNSDYLSFVLSRAAESYKNQYGAATLDDGITAAREAYNAALPAPEATPETEA